MFIFNVPCLGHMVKFIEKKTKLIIMTFQQLIGAVEHTKKPLHGRRTHCKCCFCFSSHTCWTMKEGRRREEEKKLTDLLILRLILIVKSNAHLDPFLIS